MPPNDSGESGSVKLPGLDLANPDVATIVRLASEFAEAYQTGDSVRVAEFYSPEAIYMAPGAPIRNGRDAIRQAYDELFATFRARVSVQIEEVAVFGSLAFDRASFSGTLTPKTGGEPIATSGRLLEVLRKEDGEWKSFRIMINSADQ